jgi:hypothetical protein
VSDFDEHINRNIYYEVRNGKRIALETLSLDEARRFVSHVYLRKKKILDITEIERKPTDWTVKKAA